MTEINFYTGVGSRKTPEPTTDRMSDIAVILYDKGYILRSGRAEGPDFAFQRGAEYKYREGLMSNSTRLRQRIYVPNRQFNRCFGELGAVYPHTFDNYAEAERIMEDIHPKGRYLKGFAREAHTRNVYEVLGDDLNTPSKFLLGYAEIVRSQPTGGTATAINLAKLYGIPVYNFYIEEEYQEACKMILSL